LHRAQPFLPRRRGRDLINRLALSLVASAPRPLSHAHSLRLLACSLARSSALPARPVAACHLCRRVIYIARMSLVESWAWALWLKSTAGVSLTGPAFLLWFLLPSPVILFVPANHFGLMPSPHAPPFIIIITIISPLHLFFFFFPLLSFLFLLSLLPLSSSAGDMGRNTPCTVGHEGTKPPTCTL
jgi:hypothetical protein